MSLLKAIDCCLYILPLTRLRSHENQHEVSPGREIRRIIVKNHSTELLLTLLSDIEQHFNDTLVDRVHLGMEFEASHTITKVNQ